MPIRSFAAFIALAAALVSGAAAAQPRQGPPISAPAPSAQPAAATMPAAKSDDGYVLGAEDVVEVEVLGRQDFKVRAKVGSDGTIQLPFLGATNAAAKTAKQLGEEVRAALEKGGYYAHPIMRVEVVSYASRYVTVLGSVGTPGLLPVDRPYRVSEVLARVGGVRENAADYVLVRPENGPEKRLMIKALATGDTAQDPYVTPGDKLFIPQAEVFYISGQVRAPGSYPVASDMTLRMAIAKGGGLTDIGSEKGVKVTRSGGRVEKPGLDAKIMPGDVVVVGERFF
jgi:polysaccharide export outer membrane protein